MQLFWKQFNVHLRYLNNWIKNNYPNKTDGIIAGENYFEIVELQSLTQQEKDEIQSYYDNLTESDEQDKFNFEKNIKSAITQYKDDAINNHLNNLDDLQKKVIYGATINETEGWQIYNWWKTQ